MSFASEIIVKVSKQRTQHNFVFKGAKTVKNKQSCKLFVFADSVKSKVQAKQNRHLVSKVLVQDQFQMFSTMKTLFLFQLSLLVFTLCSMRILLTKSKEGLENEMKVSERIQDQVFGHFFSTEAPLLEAQLVFHKEQVRTCGQIEVWLSQQHGRL